MAIVHVFETSRAFGDYAACVVLDDGAGVSYGINQFTHRSGSLAAVVERYLESGAGTGRKTLSAAMPVLRIPTTAAIGHLAANTAFKRALRSAAATPEMQRAQREIAFERYLRPALAICEARDFNSALALAIIYDSVTHGSFERIASQVTPLGVIRAATQDAALTERRWVTEYVERRHRWLTGLTRLRTTNYRTKFFLDQIATGNWTLRLPLIVRGVRLTEAMFAGHAHAPADALPPTPPADGHAPADDPLPGESAANGTSPALQTDGAAVSSTGGDAVSGGLIETAGETLASAAAKFDRVDAALSAVATRRDAAKSLWTTILGTIWQAVWAVFGFIIGLPRFVWIVVAVVAAVLAFAYLYRQIMLGRMRESSR